MKDFGKSLYSGEQPLTAGTPGSIDQSRKLTLPNLLPPPQAFQRLRGDWGTRETSEKRERGMLGTSVGFKQGGKWEGKGERRKSRFALSPLPITPFVPAFLNN